MISVNVRHAPSRKRIVNQTEGAVVAALSDGSRRHLLTGAEEKSLGGEPGGVMTKLAEPATAPLPVSRETTALLSSSRMPTPRGKRFSVQT